MVKLPDHCSGKLSQLLNALALTALGSRRIEGRLANLVGSEELTP